MTPQEKVLDLLTGHLQYNGMDECIDGVQNAANAIGDLLKQAEHDRDQALERMRQAEAETQQLKTQDEKKTKALWDILDCTGGVECTGMEAPEDVWGIAFEALGGPTKDRWEDAAA